MYVCVSIPLLCIVVCGNKSAELPKNISFNRKHYNDGCGQLNFEDSI